jgi:ArsR family transcriptional regulator
MPGENMVYNQIEDLALLLKSISHPIRLKILCLLQDQELSVSEIRDSVETSGANITQHLNILRNQGVNDFRKDANFIYNRIADKRIIELMKALQQIFCSVSSQQSINNKT